MSIHNDTCGSAECGNYGQVYNPYAIHNQTCGCAECGNYPLATRAAKQKPPAPAVEMVAVPVELLDEVRALIAKSGDTLSCPGGEGNLFVVDDWLDDGKASIKVKDGEQTYTATISGTVSGKTLGDFIRDAAVNGFKVSWQKKVSDAIKLAKKKTGETGDDAAERAIKALLVVAMQKQREAEPEAE